VGGKKPLGSNTIKSGKEMPTLRNKKDSKPARKKAKSNILKSGTINGKRLGEKGAETPKTTKKGRTVNL